MHLPRDFLTCLRFAAADQDSPDPSFPGCLYSEMKCVLRLASRGCTKENYDVEVSRGGCVSDRLSAHRSGWRSTSREREAASEGLILRGRAAAVHRVCEKAGELNAVCLNSPANLRMTSCGHSPASRRRRTIACYFKWRAGRIEGAREVLRLRATRQ